MIPGCMMQLCSHFTGGLMTVYDSNLDDTLERFAGAWIQSGWFLYLGASLALAIDRTLTFVIVVSDRNAVLISYLFLALSWAIALLYLIGLMIPGYGFTYRSTQGYFDWFYDKQPGTRVYLTMEMCLDFSMLAIVLSLYFIVFTKLIRMRRGGSGSISSSKAELRILIIAVVSFLYESTYLLWFFWGTNLLSDGIASCVIVTDFSMLAIVLSLYFIVFTKLIRMRRGGSGTISSSKAELRILIIAVVSFLYESTYLLWFFWGTNLLSDGIASCVIVTGLWIFDCGFFSVATIIINGSIRRKLINFVNWKSKKSKLIVVARVVTVTKHGTTTA
uniref:G_PROTEIN_RECEP_F1_2 domain-containing protein n=1 Tax=Steinernema glaseri TaxID=37863 RepID=A0A1I8AHU6_9BILA